MWKAHKIKEGLIALFMYFFQILLNINRLFLLHYQSCSTVDSGIISKHSQCETGFFLASEHILAEVLCYQVRYDLSGPGHAAANDKLFRIRHTGYQRQSSRQTVSKYLHLS